jgi:aconitate hydratase
MRFAARGTPVVIVAGRNYGTGSARDWAAKGTALLGVRAVIARSFERIHRANLFAMSVLTIVVASTEPLPDIARETRISTLGIGTLSPARPALMLRLTAADGSETTHDARADIRSQSQFAQLAGGGLFALLKARYGREAVPN